MAWENVAVIAENDVASKILMFSTQKPHLVVEALHATDAIS